MYKYGMSNKPRLTYAVACVLMGIDAILATDPEDALNIADVSIEETGLEEADAPIFGCATRRTRANRDGTDSGINELCDWFYDGDNSQMSA